MDVVLRLKLTGPDAVFLATITNFVTMLGNLEVFKSAPAHLEHSLISSHLGQYHNYYVAGKHGDRVNISLRNGARQTLTAVCLKALHYLQAVATEDDLPALLQGGVTLGHRPHRKIAGKSQTSPE